MARQALVLGALEKCAQVAILAFHPVLVARDPDGLAILAQGEFIHGAVAHEAFSGLLPLRDPALQPFRLVPECILQDRYIQKGFECFAGMPAREALDGPVDDQVLARQAAQGFVIDRFPARNGPEFGSLQRILEQVLRQGGFVLEIGLLFAALDLIERWLRDINVPALHQLTHLAVEESQQQGTDMRAVHVGIGHDDQAVIAQFLDIEFFLADPATQCRDQGTDLSGSQHAVEACAFDIEDLALQWQDGLRPAVPRLLGGASGRIALDHEQFALGGVALLAIGQFAGQAGDIHGALSPSHFPRLAGRLTRMSRLDDLANHGLGLSRAFQQVFRKLLAGQALDHRLYLGRHQLVLGLRGELRIGYLDRQHRGQALARVVAAQADLGALGKAFLLGVLIDRARQGRPQAGQVRAAVALRDVIGKAEDVLLVAVIPLHGQLNHDIVTFRTEIEDVRVQRRAIAV